MTLWKNSWFHLYMGPATGCCFAYGLMLVQLRRVQPVQQYYTSYVAGPAMRQLHPIAPRPRTCTTPSMSWAPRHRAPQTCSCTGASTSPRRVPPSCASPGHASTQGKACCSQEQVPARLLSRVACWSTMERPWAAARSSHAHLHMRDTCSKRSRSRASWPTCCATMLRECTSRS